MATKTKRDDYNKERRRIRRKMKNSHALRDIMAGRACRRGWGDGKVA